MLNETERKMLLDLARQAVGDFVEGERERQDLQSDAFPAALREEKGIFVAIYRGRELRGCVGSVPGVLPLWQACRENARGAALKDARFTPVSREELPALRYEITIIRGVQGLGDLSWIRPGRDGLILKKGFRQEVFLPGSVSTLLGQGGDVLAGLKEKAGIDPRDDAAEEWELFEAEVISEAA